MSGVFRRFDVSDFEAFERFARFNSAFKDSYFPARNLTAVESWNRFCQLVGHWEIRGYGWYGFFKIGSKSLMGIVGAEFSPFLRNPEFTLISSEENRRLHTWEMMASYLQTQDWRLIEDETYVRVNKENSDCKAILRRCGFKQVLEQKYAENSTAEIWKLDWSLAIDRYNKSKIHSATRVQR